MLPLGWLRTALVAVLMVAAALHLWLTPAHFEESTLMGIGFLAAATAQFGLALAVLLRPMGLVYITVIAVAVALIGMYGYSVAVGLPFGGSHQHAAADASHELSDSAEHGADADEESKSDDHHEEGLVVGRGEPIDALGATTKLSEMAAIGLAIALLFKRQNRRR